jgi:hypothetical protein
MSRMRPRRRSYSSPCRGRGARHPCARTAPVAVGHAGVRGMSSLVIHVKARNGRGCTEVARGSRSPEGTRLEACLPGGANRVLSDQGIRSQQQHLMFHGLTHEHAVERVLVVRGQLVQMEGGGFSQRQ